MKWNFSKLKFIEIILQSSGSENKLTKITILLPNIIKIVFLKKIICRKLENRNSNVIFCVFDQQVDIGQYFSVFLFQKIH